jgi:hypothetical protein
MCVCGCVCKYVNGCGYERKRVSLSLTYRAECKHNAHLGDLLEPLGARTAGLDGVAVQPVKICVFVCVVCVYMCACVYVCVCVSVCVCVAVTGFIRLL